MTLPRGDRDLFLGIDVGSTTVKYVLCDGNLRILASRYTPHDTRQAATLLELLDALTREHPDLFRRIGSCFITGSGAAPLAPLLGARFVQEVNAVVLAVERLHPEVHAVIELGGQDAKIIHFRPGGEGKSRRVISSMNDKCASGTGATIEKCTMKVGLSPEEAQAIRFDPGRLHHVAAKCGVFAETDIVNLLKSSIPADEIMNSLADAIVMQNLTVLTRGHTLLPDVLLLGGPNTYLPFLRECWRHRIAELWREREVPFDPAEIDRRVYAPENAQYYAALGAVIFGRSGEERSAPFAGLESLRDFVRTQGSALRRHSDTPLVRNRKELDDFLREYTLPPFRPEIPDKPTRCWLGIDGGSTSSKAVLCDDEGAILFKAYRLSAGNPIEDTVALLEEIRRADPSGRFRIAGLGVTGYAADVLEGALGADANIIETIAHMRSAQHLFGKEIDVICDIGGQDIKVLFLENGMMKNFRLSNQCSAGNGTLLQSMARQFGVPIESYADVAFSAPQAPRFNYGCAVFLDSDRVNFQREGYTREELFAGIAKVLPKNVWQYVVQAPRLSALGRRFVLQGGTQYNLAALKAQVDYIRAEVPGAEVLLHPHCAEAGAHGAALEARERVLRRGESRFVGLEVALGLRYTTRTDESTRCRFCSIGCSRTFIDTHLPGRDPVRYIAGFGCEDGTVESAEALRELRREQKRRQTEIPNLVAEEAERLFGRFYEPEPLPEAGTPVEEDAILFPLGKWGPKLTRRRQRPFRRSSPESAARRRRTVIALPRVLNLYSVAPFLRSYLESLGIDPAHILFSPETHEEMFLEGAKYGSVDACYPAKAAQAHLHTLLFSPRFRRRRIRYVWFPALTHLPGFLRHTQGQTACPVVTGTPAVVRSAFVKERNLFAEADIDYVEDPLDFDTPGLLEHQLYRTWGKRLEISEDENRWAVRQGLAALRRHEEAMMRRGREILDDAEARGEVVLLLLGRPYHSDPGLHHEIPDAFQALGYRILSTASLPRDPRWLERWFGEEIRAGIIEDPFDIRDVWPENFSTNSAQKVWAAKLAARHPNIAVVDLSSFKCGHDAPTYAIIDRILGAARTPHLTLHDIDANKPGGSFKIRIRTFAYTLEEYARTLRKRRKKEPAHA
jgi:predicted CoA-substrate-specific enzyme activase